MIDFLNLFVRFFFSFHEKFSFFVLSQMHIESKRGFFFATRLDMHTRP